MADLTYEVVDRIATITLTRPDKLNAFTGPMIDAWAKALAEAQADEGVHVVIVTGAGRAFCAGGDVSRMTDARPHPRDGKTSLWEHIHRVPKTLEAMDKPVSVSGSCSAWCRPPICAARPTPSPGRWPTAHRFPSA